MTSINIFLETDAVHLFSDTQLSIEGYGGIAQASKCTALPHLQAAIATRGDYGVLEIVTHVACWTCGSAKSLKTSFAWQLKTVVSGNQLTQEKRDALKRPFDVFVVGWADDRPYAYMFFNHDEHGLAAWKVVDLPYGGHAPPLNARLLKRMSRSPEPIGMMPEIISAQVSAEPTIIGGLVQQTTVTATEIYTKIVGRITAE